MASTHVATDIPGVTTQSRLFFALWPPHHVVPDIMRCAHQAHASCGGRVMKDEHLHLTLAFLGNTSADRVGDLLRAVQHWTISTGRITLNRIGRFRGPGVVWAGPAPGQPEWLYGVYDNLWDRLEALGYQRPESPFRPHVSLLRNAGDPDKLTCQPISWISGPAVLIASTPQPGGSRYQALATLRAA